ncbi:MAG: hypothetical protein FWD61_03930 [Phycisphaerales bacterium]|nr:hypothetical protein [Phycisphaerales bacterium]
MKLARIEFNGKIASANIHRDDFPDRHFILCIDPHPYQVGKRMNRAIPLNTSDEELMKFARDVQRRTDGYRGSDDEVQEFFREMKRFQTNF